MNGRIVVSILMFVQALAMLGCESKSSTQEAQTTRVVPAGIAAGSRRLVDAKNNRVWSLSDQGLRLSAKTQAQTAAQTVAIVLPGWNALNAHFAEPPAFAFGPNNELVVTSNVMATLWRVDADSLAVSVHPMTLNCDTEKEFGFTWLAYSDAQGGYFAFSEQLDSVWRVDRRLENAQKVAMPALQLSKQNLTAPRYLNALGP